VAGVTASDFKTAAVTVKVAPLETSVVGSVAMTVATPSESAVASPFDPGAFDTETMPGDADVQVTVFVMFLVVPSLYVPVAASCCVVPSGRLLVAGVTAIERRRAAVTVRLAVPLTPAILAVIVAVPTPAAMATPLLPATLETLAIAFDELDHVASSVRSKVVLSEYVPVATKLCVVPFGVD
jgi:hypothetical protein